MVWKTISKLILYTYNKLIVYILASQSTTGNTEEATFIVAKYICLEQQTLAWKKKSNANSHNEETCEPLVSEINTEYYYYYYYYYSEKTLSCRKMRCPRRKYNAGLANALSAQYKAMVDELFEAVSYCHFSYIYIVLSK